MPFKVIQCHRFWYQSKVHIAYDFLLVININLLLLLLLLLHDLYSANFANLPPVLHRFQVMADYSSKFRCRLG